MKLRQISSNCHELRLSKGTILFSYDTPVAVSFDLPCQSVGDLWGVYKTNAKFGQTTTRHINSWTKTERSFEQHVIEDLAHRILREA